MAQHLNSAAIDSLKNLNKSIDDKLREIMALGGFDGADIDKWVHEIATNGSHLLEIKTRRIRSVITA